MDLESRPVGAWGAVGCGLKWKTSGYRVAGFKSTEASRGFWSQGWGFREVRVVAWVFFSGFWKILAGASEAEVSKEAWSLQFL